MSAEVLSTLTEPKPIRIARVVCVAPISIKSLSAQLNAGVPITDIYFSEALLIRKSNKSRPSAGLVMPVGGAVDPEESFFEGGMRELGEEITAISMDAKVSARRWDDSTPHLSFTFKIPGYNTPRTVAMFVHGVQSSDVSSRMSREGSDGAEDKIQEVVPFSPSELKELIETGSLTRNDEVIQAAGHFIKTPDHSIEIGLSEKQLQENILENVMTDVDEFERDLKTETLNSINLLKNVKREDEVTDLSNCTQEEIEIGFVSAQIRMTLEDTIAPRSKADLLKILPYLTILPPETLPDLLLSVANMEVGTAVTRIEGGFAEGVKAIINGLPIESIPKSHNKDSLNALKSIWPEFLMLPLTERIAILKEAEAATIKSFVDDQNMGIEKEDVAVAIDAARYFHDFITADLQSRKTDNYDIFQEFRPMDEVSNAGLFSHMILALGMHPNRDIEGAQPDSRLQFEAMRNLAIFSVALEVAKQLREADNSLFQGAVDSFFQFPPKKQILNLGDNKLHPVYHRVTEEIDGRSLHVITDQRVKKGILSGVRKRLQDPRMHDIYSVNFIIADDNYNGTGDSIEERFAVAQSFRDSLLEHVSSQLDGDPNYQWQISMVPKTHNTSALDRVRDHVFDENNTSPSEYGGKRAGSKGDAIIREKFILKLESSAGETQFVEVCIYPFESSTTERVAQLGEAGFWGFAEKLRDDYEGNYKAMRLLARENKNPTEQSLYELLYPWHLYDIIALRMMKEHITLRDKGYPSGE